MERIAIVDGIRTPFAKAWTIFEDDPAQKLGAACTRELLERTHLDPELVDEVIFGCVAQPMEASNLARVIALYSGVPERKRAYTISRNCASGLESVTSAMEKIQVGFDEIVIAGGAESMSNIPLTFGKPFAKILMRLSKAKSAMEKLALITSIRPSYLKPVISLAQGLTDPFCGLNMGNTAELLAKELGISRREQDEFSLESHRKAVAGKAKLREEIVPFITGRKFDKAVEDDNGPREGLQMDSLAKMKPFFDRVAGSVTIGNSCQVTDGACALLVMKESKARAMGYEPLGYVRSYAYEGLDPSRMGLGPAYAIPVALKKAGLTLKDMGLVEINEAFAAQVLACLKMLASRKFANEVLSQPEAVGEVDPAILNVNGGGISVGHPVGATGSRLILTTLKEMKRRGLQFGVASLCVGGGLGGALVLER